MSSADAATVDRSEVTSGRSLVGPARGMVGSLALLTLAELLTRAGLVSSTYLPPASTILGETGRLLGDTGFLGAVWATVRACLIGLGLATAVAVPLGIVLGLGRVAHAGAMAIIEFLRPIPSVALIPLAILVFGRGTDMKVALILYACLWPILFNTIYGMRAVDEVSVDTARVLGFSRFRTGLLVHLPSASPFIFTGFKVAASIAVILAITAELLAGGREGDGIGVQMVEASTQGDQLEVYGATVVAGLLGLVLYVALTLLERRLFAWAAEGGGA